jgi:hypothetical protein
MHSRRQQLWAIAKPESGYQQVHAHARDIMARTVGVTVVGRRVSTRPLGYQLGSLQRQASPGVL